MSHIRTLAAAALLITAMSITVGSSSARNPARLTNIPIIIPIISTSSGTSAQFVNVSGRLPLVTRSTPSSFAGFASYSSQPGRSINIAADVFALQSIPQGSFSYTSSGNDNAVQCLILYLFNNGATQFQGISSLTVPGVSGSFNINTNLAQLAANNQLVNTAGPNPDAGSSNFQLKLFEIFTTNSTINGQQNFDNFAINNTAVIKDAVDLKNASNNLYVQQLGIQ